MMKLVRAGLLVAFACQPGFAAVTANAQTFTREGQLIVAPEQGNTAAAQVAVAQTRLFGSMLVSYRVSGRPGQPARIVVATRSERQVIEVHPETFQLRLIQRERTAFALPRGALVCRSYAPIDAILAAGRKRFAGQGMDVIPPHRPGLPWQVKVGAALHRVQFDAQGYARFKAQLAR